jgi:hypothetical protein
MNTAEQLQPRVGGLKSVLRTAQKPETTTAKSKTPTLQVGQEIKELAKEIADLKKQMDSAETKFKQRSQELIDFCIPQRIELCKKEYLSTIRIPTADDLSVTITWSGNYIKIPPSAEQMLINILGESAYSEYFKSKFVIQATDKTDDELMRLFQWLSPDDGDTEEGLAIGQERFTQFFAVDEVIRPTERFIRDHVLMTPAKKEELLMAGVKQYQPSVKSR